MNNNKNSEEDSSIVESYKEFSTEEANEEKGRR